MRVFARGRIARIHNISGGRELPERRVGPLLLDEEPRAKASGRSDEKESKQIVLKVTQFTENEGGFRCSLSALGKVAGGKGDAGK